MSRPLMSLPRHHPVPVVDNGPPLAAGFLDASWASVPALAVEHFHARSSAHRPVVTARLVASATHLHCCWRVLDRHVRSRVVEPNGPVCTDSCVELFIAPRPSSGYFNLEINAGGTVHCSYIEDPTLVDGRFAKLNQLPLHDLERIAVRTTLPKVIDPELPGPVSWEVSVAIAFSLFADYVGVPVKPVGTWRANLYKCADHTSAPHWASWSPLGELLSFHQPVYFGYLHFI